MKLQRLLLSGSVYGKTLFPVLILFFCAVLLRVIHFGTYGVGFDQVQILEHGTQILKKDFALIGPRTGPANMFTGPLIYYITAPFIAVFGELASVVLVPTFLALVTGIMLFLLTKIYIGEKQAWIVTVIWALSPFLIFLDRTFWNPNLMLLSSIFIFIPLLQKDAKKKDANKTLLFLFLGALLAYQAHFSGFLLIGLGFVSILFHRRSWKNACSMVVGLLFSIIPTAIFDLRNSYLNSRGFLAFMSEKSEFHFDMVLKDVAKNIYTLIESFGKIFFFGNSTTLIVVTGIFFCIVALMMLKRSEQIRFSLGWIVLIAVAYAAYKGSKPEYYFMVAIPPFLFMLSEALQHVSFRFLCGAGVFFFLFSLFMNVKYYAVASGSTVGNIYQIQLFMKDKQVKEIKYDMPFGTDIGLRYMLSSVPIETNGSIVHISYPDSLRFSGVKHISDIGVWVDPRNDEHTFLFTDRYFLMTSLGYKVYQDFYPKSELQPYDAYIVTDGQRVIGDLAIARQDDDKIEWVRECLVQREKTNSWAYVGDRTYLRSDSGYCMKLQTRDAQEDLTALGISVF